MIKYYILRQVYFSLRSSSKAALISPLVASSACRQAASSDTTPIE